MMYNNEINKVDSRGKKKGVWRACWENGDVQKEITFDNDLKNGRTRIFWQYINLPGYDCFYENNLLEGEAIGYTY